MVHDDIDLMEVIDKHFNEFVYSVFGGDVEVREGARKEGFFLRIRAFKFQFCFVYSRVCKTDNLFNTFFSGYCS